MKLVISDDQGNSVGELYTDEAHLWRDVLLYASERWESQSRAQSGDLLEMLLAGHTDTLSAHVDPA